MPIDSMLVSAAVVAMFVIFAGVLAWADRQTRSLQHAPADSDPKRRSF
jgi:Tfp pilus assembly protein PilV